MRWFAAPEIIVVSVAGEKCFRAGFFFLCLKSAVDENARLAVKAILFQVARSNLVPHCFSGLKSGAVVCNSAGASLCLLCLPLPSCYWWLATF